VGQNPKLDSKNLPASRQVQQFNNSTIQQFNNSTIQQFNNSTIQQFNNSTIQQFNNSTIQQSKFLQRQLGAIDRSKQKTPFQIFV
jgi:hypothetical protein